MNKKPLSIIVICGIVLIIGVSAFLIFGKQITFDFDNIDEIAIAQYGELDIYTAEYEIEYLDKSDNNEIIDIVRSMTNRVYKAENPQDILDGTLTGNYCYELKADDSVLKLYFIIKSNQGNILYIHYKESNSEDFKRYVYFDRFNNQLLELKEYFENNRWCLNGIIKSFEYKNLFN